MKDFIELHDAVDKTPLLININQIVSVSKNEVITNDCIDADFYSVQESYNKIKKLILEAQSDFAPLHFDSSAAEENMDK